MSEESNAKQVESPELAETPEEEKAGKPEELTPEERKAKKKKKEKGAFGHYKIEGETLTRLRPFCERCGPGYFMADHGTRFTCGHCGFTRYKQNQK